MGKTAKEKRPPAQPPSGAIDRVDGAGASPQAITAEEPVEPLERARLQAEVAHQRVRIAKDELKRARKRVKEAKREAKRARKQAAATRKAWKKARKAHRADEAPETPAGTAHARRSKGSVKRKRRRRRAAGGAPQSKTDGNAPVTPSSEI